MLVLVLALLAGCGRKGALEPPPGGSAPNAAAIEKDERRRGGL